MMCGVGTILSRRSFQICIILVGQEASVSEVMSYANERVTWDIQFRRLVNDQESLSLDSFLVLIYSTKVRGVGVNKLCWKATCS